MANLEFISGKMPHPLGEIYMELKKENGRFAGEVILPQGLAGRFIWLDKEISLKGGRNIFGGKLPKDKSYVISNQEY